MVCMGFEPRWKDGRYRRIHWATASPLVSYFFIIRSLYVCLSFYFAVLIFLFLSFSVFFLSLLFLSIPVFFFPCLSSFSFFLCLSVYFVCFFLYSRHDQLVVVFIPFIPLFSKFRVLPIFKFSCAKEFANWIRNLKTTLQITQLLFSTISKHSFFQCLKSTCTCKNGACNWVYKLRNLHWVCPKRCRFVIIHQEQRASKWVSEARWAEWVSNSILHNFLCLHEGGYFASGTKQPLCK